MTTISSSDLSRQLPAILARIALGEEFLVLESGQPVARFSSPSPVRSNSLTSQESVRSANAALLSHCLPGIAAGGTENDAIDRDLAHEYLGTTH